jgi:acetolactate synthase I/II/III large subunit
MRMRVADYITNKLFEAGGEHVFLVTGGMIMHLTDALYQHPKQNFISCHHEQAAAMAADAYGRFTGKLGVAYVTAGPGALNTITGVAGAYVDSAPCVIVAGNSKVSLAKIKGPRQFPLQGFDTLSMFKPITKYAVMIEEISQVKYEVEKCIHIATSHRVGPVYLEVPVDIQGAYFDPADYKGYENVEAEKVIDLDFIKRQVVEVAQAIKSSKRPCLLVGAGVRHAGAIDAFHQFIEKANIPTLTSRLGMDLINHEHPLFIGRPGTYGDRPANFAVQNSDLLLTVGCRLGIGLVGYDFQDFAGSAKKIIVDIDEKELEKPSVVADIAIKADAKLFFELLIEQFQSYSLEDDEWLKQAQYWKERYPVDLPEYLEEKDGINSYHFTSVFSEKASKDSVFVLDTGSCFHVHAQAFKVKYGQRHIITGGLSTMGYSPASTGVAAANGSGEVYCITGDGSIMMNLQEMQTVSTNKLPIKFVVFNNNGYLLIRHTQNNFMEGRFIGESPQSGVGFPDMAKIADAFGLHYMKISNLDELDQKTDELLSYEGAMICEVMTPSNQLLIPRVSSKKLEDGTMISMPYDDMFPFLPRDEYQENCVRNKT